MKGAMTSVALALVAAATAEDAPKPDGRDRRGPLKVYILAGQSNMQGHAHIRTLGYLKEILETQIGNRA